MRWRAMSAVLILVPVLGLAACGGGGGGDGSESLLGLSDTPGSTNARVDLSRDGSELLYTWGAELKIADLSGARGGEPANYEHSLYDTDDVAWYAGVSLGFEAPSAVNTVQLVDDGTIAFTTIENSSTVRQVSRDGAEIRTIELPADASDVFVAPAFGHVYWVDRSGEGLALARQPLDGGDTERLVEWGYDDWFGGYDVSADGTRLGFTFGLGGADQSEVYVAGADGSDPVSVAKSAWAPRFDGDDLLIAEDAGVDDDKLPLQQIAVVPSGGGDPTRLTDDRLQKSGVYGRLPDGRVLYEIESYGYEPVFGISDSPD